MCLLRLGFGSGSAETAQTSGGSEKSGADTSPHELPASIGPYKILDVLGEGGMGIVYLAEQTEPVHRRVALKLIKLGMDTRQVLARFEAERQALAILNHPNVAKVFDAGVTGQGRPYFVMEYVAGLPITEYCDLRCLPVRERLDLFLQVCEAIQHAHQKGIIHRDVKPSNVLVSEEEGKLQLKVIDFGIAKATSQKLTERTLFTQRGVLIGTPGYISPEQAGTTGLDVDTRTDIYSMGVLLYELLVGALPFDPQTLRRAAATEMLRIIREEEAPKVTTRFSSLGDTAREVARKRATDVRSLARQLQGELEWITMRALEKEPARRYGSPQEMAADLRRYLNDEPVLAGPPGAAYRARRFVTRHRVGVAAAGVLLLGLGAGIVGSTLGLVRAKRAETRARQEAETSERVSRFLADMLGDVDPERAGLTLLADLRKRVSDARRARGGESGDGVTLALASFDEAMLGVNVTDTGLRLLNEEILARAAVKVDELLQAEPEIAGRLYFTIGETYLELDQFEAAARCLRQAVDLSERSFGPEHPNTLEAKIGLATVDMTYRRFAEAESRLRRIHEVARRSLGKEHPVTLRAARKLARALIDPADSDEAVALCRETLESCRRVLGSDHEDSIRAMARLANRYELTGRQAEAESLYREAHETARRTLGEDHRLALQATSALVRVLGDAGRYDEAETLQLKNREVARHALGDGHSTTIYATKLLGDIYHAQGRDDAAEAEWREALDRYRSRPSGDMSDLTRYVVRSLLDLYGRQGREDDARAVLASLVADCTGRIERGEEPARLYGCVSFVQTVEPAELRDPQTAVQLASRLCEATGFEDPTALSMLAAAYDGAGETERAIETLREGLSSLPQDDSHRRAGLEDQLVWLYGEHGWPDDARPLAMRAMTDLRSRVEKDDADLDLINRYAWLLLTVRPSDLRDPQRALELARRTCGESGFENPYWLDTLALAYHRTGDTERAIETQRKALSLLPAQDTETRGELEQRLAEYEAVLGVGGT